MVLGRLFKVHPDFESLVFDVLERDECGVVALISEKVGGWNDKLWERMRGRHEARVKEGRQDVLERVRFVSYWNYVHVLSHASCILDTYPYGGCLTAQEAMSNGKVVVTLPGPYVRGRFTKGLYEQMGEAEASGGWPVAESGEEFVELAVRVGRNEGGYRDRVKEDMRLGWERVHKEELGGEWAEALEGMWKGAL